MTKQEYNEIIPLILPAHKDYIVISSILDESFCEHINEAMHILETDDMMSAYLLECEPHTLMLQYGQSRMWNTVFYNMHYARYQQRKAQAEIERQSWLATKEAVTIKQQSIRAYFAGMGMDDGLIRAMFGKNTENDTFINNFHAELIKAGHIK